MKTKAAADHDAGMWSMRPSDDVRARMEAILQVCPLSRSEIIEKALLNYFPKLAEQVIKDAEESRTVLAKMFNLRSKP